MCLLVALVLDEASERAKCAWYPLLPRNERERLSDTTKIKSRGNVYPVKVVLQTGNHYLASEAFHTIDKEDAMKDSVSTVE